MPLPIASRIINRKSELKILRDGLKLARQNRPGVILVEGEVGIGKTRLIDEFLAKSRVTTLRGSCLPAGGQSLPYSPFVEMLRSLDRKEVGSWPDSLDPLLSTAAPNVGAGSNSRIRLFQGVADLFEAMATTKSMVVIIEDLQWADRSTGDLISFLIALLNTQKLGLVITCRSEVLDPGHPLRDLIVEWLRHSFTTHLRLGPLSVEDSARLLAEIASPNGFDERDIQTTIAKAGGNPYFLQEMANHHRLDITPGSVKHLLTSVLQELPDELRALLRIASLEGGRINDQALGDVAGIPEDEVVRLLRLAVESRILVIENNYCRFRQPLMVEVLKDDLLPAERRQFHRAYAASLINNHPLPPPQRLAFHQSGAGDFDLGVASYISAGIGAEGQFAFAEAHAAYTSAVDLWDVVARPETVTGMSKTDLRRRQFEMAFLAGEPEEACRLARHALVEAFPDESGMTRGLINARLARYLCNTPNYAEALEIQLRAVELIPAAVSPERAGVLAGLAWLYQYEGLLQQAAATAQEALEMAASASARASAISAKNTLGNAVAITDDLDRGLELIAEAREQAR